MTLLSSLELNVMNYAKLFNYCNNEAFNHAITKLKDCSSTLKLAQLEEMEALL